MAPKKKNLNGMTTGEDSQQLQEFKRETGLVTKEEIKRLEPSTIQELQKKIQLLDQYTVAQQRLVDLFGSMNGRVINALIQVMDLQTKLLELEESLKEQGVNPLTSPEWIKAREMLSKETQFIHKHGLDIAEVTSRIRSRKDKRGEDILFEVDGVVKDEDI
jgi:hypothetical protein